MLEQKFQQIIPNKKLENVSNSDSNFEIYTFQNIQSNILKLRILKKCVFPKFSSSFKILLHSLNASFDSTVSRMFFEQY